MPRIALVSPILPVPHDLTRGRFIHETARALSRLATVRVFFPQVRYPKLPGLAPRSFLQGEVGPDYRLEGVDALAYTYPGIPVVSRASNGYVGARALLPRLEAFDADIVLAYWLYPDGFAALRAARRLGLPCIVGARGSDMHLRSGVTVPLTRRTLAGADAVLTVSKAMGNAAVTRYGVDPAKVHTIVNGIDTNVFHRRDRLDMRGKLGIPPDVRLITYVGRFIKAKGLVELLDAFAEMAASAPKLTLALVGDGVMRAELVKAIAAKGLQDRVLLPGALPPAQVAEWICASDVLTLPSWSEGYPNVVVEAIACGCPVVASDVGGVGEIVDAESGILVRARNAPALRDALGSALSRAWDRDAMATSMGRSWNHVAEETLAVCTQVIASSRRSRAAA